jgi:hypothetical protein
MLCAGAVLAASVFAGAQAHAVTLVTFTTFNQAGTGRIIDWTRGGAGHLADGSLFSTLPNKSVLGSPLVIFNFQDTTSYLDNLKASLTLSGSEAGHAATTGVIDEQCCINGSFSFIYQGPDGVTDPSGNVYHTGVTNLLSGVFTLGKIDGAGSSGSFHDSTDFGTIVYTSDIVHNLGSTPAADFSIALNAIRSPLGASPGDALNSFKAAASGAFSIAVPEPATWAMMITGIGLLGLAARRRRASSPIP